MEEKELTSEDFNYDMVLDAQKKHSAAKWELQLAHYWLEDKVSDLWNDFLKDFVSDGGGNVYRAKSWIEAFWLQRHSEDIRLTGRGTDLVIPVWYFTTTDMDELKLKHTEYMATLQEVRDAENKQNDIDRTEQEIKSAIEVIERAKDKLRKLKEEV